MGLPDCWKPRMLGAIVYRLPYNKRFIWPLGEVR